MTPLWLMVVIVFGVSMTVIQIRSFWFAGLSRDSARLFSRLSNPGVAKVKRLTVRDHYVDVMTDQGTETLLMRFSDALLELDGIEGMQVHRSHWVADEAVQCLERETGRLLVVLDNGDRIPVSRGNRESVEARYS